MLYDSHEYMRAPSWMLLVAGSVAVCGIFGSACSLFTSLSGYSGSDDVSPGTADGAVPADAPSSDAPNASDAGDSGDGSPSGPFCISLLQAPAVCEDFDSVQPLAAWNVREVGTGSTVTTTTSTFRSAPRAMRAEIGPPPATRRAFLERSLPALANHVRYAYSLYIDERPTNGQLEVNIVRITANAGLMDFFLSVSAGGVQYVQQFGDQTTLVPLSRPVPLKTWARIELDVLLTGAKTLTVRVDGVEAARTTAVYADPGTPNVQVGITYTAPEPERGVILLDDVTFEILQ